MFNKEIPKLAQEPKPGWTVYVPAIGLALIVFLALTGSYAYLAIPVADDWTQVSVARARDLACATVASVVGVTVVMGWLRHLTLKNFVLVFITTFLTANGGGTICDLLLLNHPSWLREPPFIIIPGVVAFAAFWIRRPLRGSNAALALRIADNFASGGFIALAVARLAVLIPPPQPGFLLAAVAAGTLSGVGGGMLRDMLVFRRVPAAVVSAAFINALVCSTAQALLVNFQFFQWLDAGLPEVWSWGLSAALTALINELTAGYTFRQ